MHGWVNNSGWENQIDGLTEKGREVGVPEMETFHSEKKAKKMNTRVGADKPVDPSCPRVVARNLEFLVINPHFYDHFNGAKKKYFSFTDDFCCAAGM